MKRVTYLMIFISMMSCAAPPSSGVVQGKNEAVFVLIENGGTVGEDERQDALSTSLHLLQQLTKLAKRKATRDTQIHILLSALPNRIIWSGTARQLLEQAGYIRDLIVFKNAFSDLVVAFEQINTTINLTQPDSVRLYWIGPTIHVAFQNATKAVEVEVPQDVPALALASFATRLSALKIMRVHPDQDQKLQDYLGSIGILDRAKSGNLDFALLGVAQTRSRINDLL